MDRIFYTIIFLLIASSACKKSSDSPCNCVTISPALDKYEYPVKPGTDEWNAAVLDQVLAFANQFKN